VLLYRGSERIQVRRFFRLTGALIILFAAGLAAKAVFFLQASGDLGSLNWAVYDLTDIRLLTTETQAGRFLAGIFGWDPRPSLEQVVAYLGYLVPVAWAYLRTTGGPVPPPRPVPEADGAPLASTASR
jgi:high-affinity iron transporter